MPCLNINEREFLPETEGSDTEDENDSCLARARFEDFVSTMLLFHSAQTLDVFRFNVVQLSNDELVDRWLRRGIKRCPKVVEICAFYHKLPHLGSSSSRLKRLHLSMVTLDGTFTQQLRSGCPVLNDLELKFCRFHSIAEIVSCTLKNLTIQHCRTNPRNTLIIKAPSLAYLQLVITVTGNDGNWAGGVVVSDMPFLIKAIIFLRNLHSNIPKVPCKLLLSLINVKYLELTGFDTLVCLFCLFSFI
jgi:hypothetical protein